MLIDTHCHLHDLEFFEAEFATEAKKRAKAMGVEKIIVIGTSDTDSKAAQRFAMGSGTGEAEIYWTYGIHPNETSEQGFKFLENYRFWREKEEPIAIGEVGLDYHYSGHDKKKQWRLFEEMLALAEKEKLPAVFHVREAFEDFLSIVDNFPKVCGVVHSFTDNKKNLKKALERGFYIGVNGMATYSTLPMPPLEKILLETDAPFLTPEPFRDKINESAYVREVALWLGNQLGVDVAEIARQTTANAEKLFNFSNSMSRSGKTKK